MIIWQIQENRVATLRKVKGDWRDVNDNLDVNHIRSLMSGSWNSSTFKYFFFEEISSAILNKCTDFRKDNDVLGFEI